MSTQAAIMRKQQQKQKWRTQLADKQYPLRIKTESSFDRASEVCVVLCTVCGTEYTCKNVYSALNKNCSECAEREAGLANMAYLLCFLANTPGYVNWTLPDQKWPGQLGELMLICDMGHQVVMTSVSLRRNRPHCVLCSKGLFYTQAQAQQVVDARLGGDRWIVDEYRGSKTDSTFTHVICGRKKECKFNYLLLGLRCSCNKHRSLGELEVESVLKAWDVFFHTEFAFRDLRGDGGGLLRFDFALFKSQDDLNNLSDPYAVVEVHGPQHYKAISHFGGEDAFQRTCIHDARKKQYALTKKIKYVELDFSHQAKRNTFKSQLEAAGVKPE